MSSQWQEANRCLGPIHQRGRDDGYIMYIANAMLKPFDVCLHVVLKVNHHIDCQCLPVFWNGYLFFSMFRVL